MRFDVITLFPELLQPLLVHGINRRAFDPVTQGAIFIVNRHVPTGQRNRNCMCVVCHTGSCSTSTTVKPCRSQNAMAPGRNG